MSTKAKELSPRSALNTILNGHAAHCDSVLGLRCPKCIREHEAVLVLRKLIEAAEGPAVEQACAVPAPAVVTPESTGGGKAELIRERLARMSPEAKLKAVEALAVFANEGAELVEKQLEVYDSIAAAVMRHDDDDVEPDQVWERVSAALRREHREAGKAQAAPAVGAWVPCEERMPTEADDWVLVWVRNMMDPRLGEQSIGCRIKECWYSHGELFSGDITHWMPLPAPPKESR